MDLNLGAGVVAKLGGERNAVRVGENLERVGAGDGDASDTRRFSHAEC
jgi:hypothetical protein